jgi:ABC-type glycerol-3-phosphate transport system permease component
MVPRCVPPLRHSRSIASIVVVVVIFINTTTDVVVATLSSRRPSVVSRRGPQPLLCSRQLAPRLHPRRTQTSLQSRQQETPPGQAKTPTTPFGNSIAISIVVVIIITIVNVVIAIVNVVIGGGGGTVAV